MCFPERDLLLFIYLLFRKAIRVITGNGSVSAYCILTYALEWRAPHIGDALKALGLAVPAKLAPVQAHVVGVCVWGVGSGWGVKSAQQG